MTIVPFPREKLQRIVGNKGEDKDANPYDLVGRPRGG
jgi:hypothetical protein